MAAVMPPQTEPHHEMDDDNFGASAAPPWDENNLVG
jgi:hypothetical protein